MISITEQSEVLWKCCPPLSPSHQATVRFQDRIQWWFTIWPLSMWSTIAASWCIGLHVGLPLDNNAVSRTSHSLSFLKNTLQVCALSSSYSFSFTWWNSPFTPLISTNQMMIALHVTLRLMLIIQTLNQSLQSTLIISLNHAVVDASFGGNISNFKKWRKRKIPSGREMGRDSVSLGDTQPLNTAKS